jgi:type I restriction enzyme, R subunit
VPSLHQEIHFEAEICSHLAAHGWLHDEGAAGAFDTGSGLYPPDLLAWLQASQPDSWQRLHKTHAPSCPRCWPIAFARA